MVLESKPSCDIIHKRKWGNRIHPPLKRREHKKLHFLNGLGFKQISTIFHLHKSKPHQRLMINVTQIQPFFSWVIIKISGKKNILVGPIKEGRESPPLWQQERYKQQLQVETSMAYLFGNENMTETGQSNRRREPQ